MDKKALFKRIKAIGMAVLALAAVGVFIFTAVDLASAVRVSTSFYRASVWRMVSCGCIAVIFPFLLIMERRDKKKGQKR